MKTETETDDLEVRLRVQAECLAFETLAGVSRLLPWWRGRTIGRAKEISYWLRRRREFVPIVRAAIRLVISTRKASRAA